MIVILSFPFYTFTGYVYMGIRIAISSDLRIHNWWEWANTPIWWSWKVKSLRIDRYTCSYSPWIRSLDLSRYKNLKSLYVGDYSFRYVKRFELKGLKKLDSVDIRGHSFQSAESLIMDSNNESHKLILRSPFSPIN